ncbi:MAG: hypothetical protein HYS62_02295 [Candidatus Aenigmarchaeota archaeon]|nr:hypothetical protein [Candidatus Aenigmarchaeota archaeon]
MRPRGTLNFPIIEKTNYDYNIPTKLAFSYDADTNWVYFVARIMDEGNVYADNPGFVFDNSLWQILGLIQRTLENNHIMLRDGYGVTYRVLPTKRSGNGHSTTRIF